MSDVRESGESAKGVVDVGEYPVGSVDVVFRDVFPNLVKICASASGVVRTGRLTGVDAARPEWQMLAGAAPPQPISRMPTAHHAGRVAPRR